VPGLRRRRHVANVVDDGPLALEDLEEEEVVLESIRADAPVAAIGCDREDDAGRLIDLAGFGIVGFESSRPDWVGSEIAESFSFCGRCGVGGRRGGAALSALRSRALSDHDDDPAARAAA